MRRLIPALVIFLTIIGPASASASEGFCLLPPEEQALRLSEPVQLCGTSVLAGSEPTAVRVYLPHDAILQNPWTGGGGVQVEGEGRFAGFALVEDVPERDGLTLLGGRLPPSAGSRLFVFDLTRLVPDSYDVESYTIPAGNYLLYLLPDGSPIEITLHLFDLEGAVTLPAGRPAAYELRFPEPRIDQVPEGYAYSAGATGVLRSEGQLFQAAWLRSSAHVFTTTDTCFFEGEPGPDAYLPACTIISLVSGNVPANMWKGTGSYDPAPTVEPRRWFGYGEWSPGVESSIQDPTRSPWGQTISVESVSLIEAFDSLALWLSFD